MKKACKIISKGFLILLCVILLFLLGVFLYHRAMLKKEKTVLSTPLGEMIEVDGGNMCVYTAGSGAHTIVFMSGYGTPSPILDFNPLYEQLQDDFRIAVVEKFGYGFSDETDMPRDIDTMLRQTRAALSGAGLEAPYILCPHSASGIEAIYWAQTYPEEVEGIAALDIAMPGYHEEQGDSIFLDQLAYFIANSGLIRFMDDTWEYACNFDCLTEAEKEQYMAIIYARRGSKTMLHEAEWAKDDRAAVSAKPVPDVPMIFFTAKQMADRVFPHDPEKYLTLARRYTDNKAEYVDLDCSHYVHLFETDLIASEIRRFAGELPDKSAQQSN